jgi:ATP-dependent DNA helicase RecQ
MKVVIVAKTRMSSGACIGALTFDGRSLRLIAPDTATNDHFNMEYTVGEVWEIEGGPPPELLPPHTENIVVGHKRRLPPIDDLAAFCWRQMPPRAGGPEVLYDGLAQRGKTGALYIAQATGVPGYSTLFWQPDRPLVRVTDSKRIHYCYGDSDEGCTLTFVGFQEPVEVIPAGSLVRVSLAHWWRAEDRPHDEFRCYVQLSGWLDRIEQTARPGEPVRLPSQRNQPAASIDQARDVLNRVYGYDEFRSLQEDIIDNILNKRDTLAVMPTGSGKSLCYQLPAQLFPGLTVVVSPLISLMEDQVMQLRELGVPAAYLNSTLSYDAYLGITKNIRAGKIKLVYAAPETLLRPETLVMLDQCPVDCLTIDEAHCISEWGHDFRPEYRQLVDVRRRLPDAVCLAVTATATERVREDIKATLDISAAAEFIAPFDRANLFLAAEPRIDGLAQTLAFLENHRGESGIIYCWTRETVDQLTAQLAANGWPALPYHAGLDNGTRQKNQRLFSHDRAPIIVATIAFGMGINKSNVRFVLHHDLPKDLESYYQQIGRAGRDGLRADCLLLHGRSDVQTANFFINQMQPAQRLGSSVRLRSMLDFAETGDCRRRPLLAYFGDSYDQETCGSCDNCLNGRDESDLVDLSVPAQKFLSCVKRTGEFFGQAHIIDILRGSRSKKILEKGHDRLSTHGIGREFSSRQWQSLAGQFVQKGLLNRDMDHGSLKLTDTGKAVLRGQPFRGVEPGHERAIGRPAGDQVYDVTLFELLRQKRHAIAEETGMPPYVIFHDTSLRDMATYYPQSRDSLGGMYGVGERKVETYGDAFLAVIVSYCRERGFAEKEKPRPRTPVTRVVVSPGRTRKDEVAERFNNGQPIAEIARASGLQERTITGHLWDYARAGGELNRSCLKRESNLQVEDQERVRAAFAEWGTERLRPVFDALGGTVSFDDLHLMRLVIVMEAK